MKYKLLVLSYYHGCIEKGTCVLFFKNKIEGGTDMEFTPVRCRIPELLARNGKDQQWLADMTGKGPQKISDYCNMRTIMNLRTAKLIAHFLKCDIGDLYVWRQREK